MSHQHCSIHGHVLTYVKLKDAFHYNMIMIMVIKLYYDNKLLALIWANLKLHLYRCVDVVVLLVLLILFLSIFTCVGVLCQSIVIIVLFVSFVFECNDGLSLHDVGFV